MSKRIAVIGGLASLGIVAGTVFLGTRAKATPQEPEKPGLTLTADDILASRTMGELEIHYVSIAQLYFSKQIDRETYEALYQAYVTRYYQLIGANQ